jgi:hypothetical protein
VELAALEDLLASRIAIIVGCFFFFVLHIPSRRDNFLRGVGDMEFLQEEACGDEAMFDLVAIYFEFDNGLDTALAGVKRVWIELLALVHAEKPDQNVVLIRRPSVLGTGV